jgi:hypothetical protein
MDVVKLRKDIRIVNEERTLNTLNLQNQPKVVESAVRETVRPAYTELPGLRHETKDVLQQLNTNIQLLEDLGGRLGFMMTEIRSLIRR